MLYCEDPDGSTVELFVDGDPAVWAEDPSTVATTKPRHEPLGKATRIVREPDHEP